MSIYGFETEGLLAPSGTRYVKITTDGGRNSTLIPLNMFAGNGQEALSRMKHNGLPVIGTKDCHALVQAVSQLDEFLQWPVAEKIGWNEGNVFALPDGSLVAPENATQPETALPVSRREPEVLGSLKQWKRSVAQPIIGQPLLQFGTMFMFAAPLLQLTTRADNFGFELVGAGGRGKSTLQRIVTSVAGRTGPGAEGHYLAYFDTTLNALEDAMVGHSDLPLVLEEANLFSQGETARGLATKFKAVAFKLGSGTMKDRWGNPGGRPVRLLYLSSSNEPLASIIGEQTSAAKAATDRLITIPVPTHDIGVLTSLPEGFADAPAFMDCLLEAASLNYGHPLREFLKRLVTDRATDEAQLRSRIATWMTEFRRRATPCVASRRVVDAFGLVYAAGKLASTYRVLPRRFRCGESALACLQLHLNRHNSGLTFAERLAALASAAVDLGGGRLPELTSEQMSTGLFRRSGRRGTELLVTTDRVSQYLEGWQKIRNRSEVTRFMNSEEGRKKVRRKIAAGQPKVRVFSFTIPD